MESEKDIDSNGIKKALSEYFATRNILAEEDESAISVLSMLVKNETLTEDDVAAILSSGNPHQALDIAFTLLLQRNRESRTEEEMEADKKARLEDQIKDNVVLLFIQAFPDQQTEERLKEWKETGRFSRFRNYNDAAIVFAENGGWRSIGRMIYGWDDSSTLEGDTIAIIDLLNLLYTSTALTVKVKKGQAKNLELTGGNKKLLERIIIEWLKPKLDPSTNLLAMAGSKESYEHLKRMAESSPNRLDFVWYEELAKIRSKLEEWHNEKICYEEGKKIDYYYSLWEEIIPWTKDQSQTDRMVFLYKLGNAFQLYELDTTLDLNNGQDRKELADRIKYSIKRQRKWEIKMGKRKGNSPN